MQQFLKKLDSSKDMNTFLKIKHSGTSSKLNEILKDDLDEDIYSLNALAEE